MPKYSLYKSSRKKYSRFKSGYKLIKQVRRLARRDIHYNDVTSSASVGTTGTVVLLNGITGGDNLNNRTGNTIYCQSLMGRFKYTNADSSNEFRTMLIYDNRPTLALPTMTDIFEVPSDPINSLLRINNTDRFKIIKEWYNVTDADDPNRWAWVKGSNPNRSMKLPKYNQYTKFDGTVSGGIGNIVRGALYLVLISDSNAVTHPTVDYYVRLRFAA